MGALFHVFVDGAADASPTGLERLADEMATKYGKRGECPECGKPGSAAR